MKKLLALLILCFVCLVTNAQKQGPVRTPMIGQTFDEIVVSSDLNVRRKSKENRQGKALLSNVPSGTTGSPERPTELALKLVSDDGIRVAPVKRAKRDIVPAQKKYLDLGLAGYLLKSRKR